MMLRASVEANDLTVDLNAVVDTSVSSGIEHGAALTAFAEAAVTRSDELPVARQRIVDELGEGALIDAAGTVANFQRMVRIADGIGIPIDEGMASASGEIREQLGLERYGSAANTVRAAGG